MTRAEYRKEARRVGVCGAIMALDKEIIDLQSRHTAERLTDGNLVAITNLEKRITALEEERAQCQNWLKRT